MDRYRAKIAGTIYLLTGVKSRDYMDRLTAAVNDRIAAVRAAHQTATITEATTLAFLNFMHDYYDQEERFQAVFAALKKLDPEQAEQLLAGPPAGEETAEAEAKQAASAFRSNSQTVLKEAADRGLTGKKSAVDQQKSTAVAVDRSTDDRVGSGQILPRSEEPAESKSKKENDRASFESDRLNAEVYAPVRQRKNRSISIDPLTGEPRPTTSTQRADKTAQPAEDSEREAGRSAGPVRRTEGYSIDPITGKARKIVKKNRSSPKETEDRPVGSSHRRPGRMNPVAKHTARSEKADQVAVNTDVQGRSTSTKTEQSPDRERPAHKPKGKSLNPFG